VRGGDELDIGIRLKNAWLLVNRYRPLLIFAGIILHLPRKDKASIKPASLLLQC
jgi:hypothetical protein